MVRCPVIVDVVTESPCGCLLEPRDVNVTSAPGTVEMPYRSASHASSHTSDDREAWLGWEVLKSPMMHTSWLNP